MCCGGIMGVGVVLVNKVLSMSFISSHLFILVKQVL